MKIADVCYIVVCSKFMRAVNAASRPNVKIKEVICHIRPIELRSGPIVAEVVDNSFVATNKAIKISVIVKV